MWRRVVNMVMDGLVRDRWKCEGGIIFIGVEM